MQVNISGTIAEDIGENITATFENNNIRLNDTQIKILENLTENKYLSAVKLAEMIGISKRNIENNIKKLKDSGVLIRHGSPKYGHWEVVEQNHVE